MKKSEEILETRKLGKRTIALMTSGRGYYVAGWEGEETMYQSTGALPLNFNRSSTYNDYHGARNIFIENVRELEDKESIKILG